MARGGRVKAVNPALLVSSENVVLRSVIGWRPRRVLHAVVQLFHLTKPGSFASKCCKRKGHGKSNGVLCNVQVLLRLKDGIQAGDHGAADLLPRVDLQVWLVANDERFESWVVHGVVLDCEALQQVASIGVIHLLEAVPAILVTRVRPLDKAPVTESHDHIHAPLQGAIEEGAVAVVQIVPIHPERVDTHGLQHIQISTAPAIPHGACDVRHEVVICETHACRFQR
mmetsp:Transcript_18162/g.34103  ORF Transcript_18162/g.34103 Transcript_18162/m.34103 type:complete len:226 (+) Transcript_18162:549-1226(+)